ncbi:MAG: FlgD immunoglobulin-like domain containing protein [candidate division WOR-3 bacterium]
MRNVLFLMAVTGAIFSLAFAQESLDVGVVRIIAPTYAWIDSGTVVTPQALVRNYGNDTVSFPVIFTIGTFYTDTQNVVNLGPDDSIVVSFTDWLAIQRGTHATKCSTALEGDTNPANNAVTGQARVRVRDVGVSQIVIPVGIIDSGATVRPLVRLTNYGTGMATFSVTFKIGDFYTQTRSKTLFAGYTDTANFPAWTANELGTHPVFCSTAYTGDVNPANDTLSDSVTVQLEVFDVGVVSILAPTGLIDSGTPIVPQVRVKNFGDSTAPFPVWFRISLLDQIYEDSVWLDLAAGEEATCQFDTWMPTAPDTYRLESWTDLTEDMNPQNDTATGLVRVRGQQPDVGVVRIISPSSMVGIDSGTVVTPQALVRNYGNVTASFPVIFTIGTFYTDTQNVVNLNPYDSIVVSFTDWLAIQRGTHNTKCSTAFEGDINPTNDYRTSTARVRVRDVGVAQIISPVGTIDSGTTVTPQVVVANYGTGIRIFPVTFRIGEFYNQTITETLTEGQIDTVFFPDWNANEIGTHVVFCSTALNGDINPANDTLSDSVTVLPLTGVVEEKSQSLPKVFVLENSLPNPFTLRTVIRYGLPKECQVELGVYNPSGVLVRRLQAGTQKPGFYTVIWDGTDDEGRRVGKGVYLYKLETNEFKSAKKIIKLR